jgi:bifunctional NMN adenylyltransferase/nudix hydrolase
MNKKFNTLVFCGRFSPFHLGHKAVVDRALELADEVVIVVGSSFQARSTKNPFTFEERKDMIKALYPNDNVKIVGVQDYPYDDNAWVSAVQRAVNSVKTGTNTGLIGHSKDHSSYYLKIFPDWRNHVEVGNVDGINATDIRAMIFGKNVNPKNISKMMPDKSYDVMSLNLIKNGKIGGWYDHICQEYSEIIKYHEDWENAPYPPTFVTTDAVLTQSGYILLIKRGKFPFKGCWALPGGYLAKGQFIVDNMIKELREETCVKVPSKVLKGSVKDVQIFDHPDRDPRGRTITHGFFIDLGYPDEKLPKVKNGDDAAHAEWVHLSELKSDMFAFDHFHIINRFIPVY